jgi:hypothetical protein
MPTNSKRYAPSALGLALFASALAGCKFSTLDEDDPGTGGEGSGTDSPSGTSGTGPGTNMTGTSIDVGGGAQLRGCETGNVEGAALIEADIDTNQNWSGTLLVRGNIDAYNVEIKIAPGTQIVFDNNSSLEFGWNTRRTVLLAEGTPEQPIRFCGLQRAAGAWSSVTIGAQMGPPSVLRNVRIENGGREDAALIIQGPIGIDGVEVRDSGSNGVRASAFGAESRNLSVSGSAGDAVVLETPLAVTTFPVGGAFSANGKNVARLTFVDANTELHLKNIGMPYLQANELDVFDVAITFDPGVEYSVAEDRTLEVGWNTRTSNLHVNGTASQPVMFRGDVRMPGSWGGVQVRKSVLSTSVISHLEIHDAGSSNQPALLIQSDITLDDVRLDGNLVGARIEESGVSANSTGLSITNTGGAPLTIVPDAIVSVPRGGSYQGNASDWIAVEGGDFTKNGTVAALDVPYRILGNFDTLENSVLTIAPGTIFEMYTGTHLEVGWNTRIATIDAVGTAAQPIVFRGVVAQPGSWEGLIIGNNVTPTSRLEYVEIGHAGGAGGSGAAALRLGTAISVTNSRFYASAGSGVLKAEADPTDYTISNTFEDTVGGTQGTY